MERLILLCLLSPAIFAGPHKIKNPNDEPFLPIYPVEQIYPSRYNSKLMKRGAEAEVNSQLTSELYAPKVDAKNTYSSSYSDNYQRDSYYPVYLTNSTPSFVYPNSYYNGGEAYIYTNAPYPSYNSYPAYAVNPASYPVPPYPNYYYQPSYYYPHYFSQALLPPPPPQPPSVYHQETSQVPSVQDDKQDADKKGERPKENETIQDAPVSQYVDGGNYIAGNSRDLDVQSSTYRVSSPYNQFGQDVNNLPISSPKLTYKVINVGGQPASQDSYQLPVAYVKTQQIEQMASQALADLLPQNALQQAGSSYENNRDISNGANDGSYENQNVYNQNAQSYVNLPGAGSKTGVTYVIDSVGIAKTNGERAKQQSSTSQKTPSKSAKHSNAYTRKPATRNHSQVSYTLPESGSDHRVRVTSARPTSQTDKYGSYDTSQNYDGTYSQSGNRQDQNYGIYQSQSGSYQSEGLNATPQTVRSHIYQYSAYESDQMQQPQRDEVNGNFGAKYRR